MELRFTTRSVTNDSQVYASLDLVLPGKDLPGTGVGPGAAPQSRCASKLGVSALHSADRQRQPETTATARARAVRSAGGCLSPGLGPSLRTAHPSLGADGNQGTPDRSPRGAEAVLAAQPGREHVHGRSRGERRSSPALEA